MTLTESDYWSSPARYPDLTSPSRAEGYSTRILRTTRDRKELPSTHPKSLRAREKNNGRTSQFVAEPVPRKVS